MRLKTEFIIAAALRQANSQAISAFVQKKGDANAGTIFLEIETDRDKVSLWHRRYDFDGAEIWECLSGDEMQPSYVIAQRLEREISRDPDCWVISVQDKAGRNIFSLSQS